jgi:hypothetical protein
MIRKLHSFIYKVLAGQVRPFCIRLSVITTVALVEMSYALRRLG